MRTSLLAIGLVWFSLLRLSAQAEPAVALQNRADSLWEVEQPVASAQTYLRAAHAYLRTGDTVAAFTNGLEAALTYEAIEDYAAAATALRQTLTFSPGGTVTTDSLRALAWHKLGVTQYYLEDYPAAAAAYQRGLALRVRRYPATHPDRIKTRRNLAYAYYYGAAYDSAIHHLNIVIRDNQARAEPDLGMLSSAYSILGNAYANIRDVRNGRAAVLAGLAIDRELLRDEPQRLGTAYYNAARYFAILEQGKEAVRYADLAIEQYTRAGARADLADALQAKGLALLSGGDYAGAETTLREALRIYERLDKSPAGKANLLFNLALVNYRRGRPAAALTWIDRAYAIVRPGGDSVEIGTTLHPRAVYLGALGHLDSAQTYFQRALAWLAPDYDPARPAAGIPDDRRIFVAELLADRAELARRHADARTAIRHYEETAAQLELIRTRFTADESRQFISQRAQPIFAGLTDLYADRFAADRNPADAAAAFRYSERTKAYNLLRALDRQRNRSATVPADWLRREEALGREIAELDRRLRQRSDPADQRRLTTLELGLQQLRDSIGRRTGQGPLPDADLPRLQRWLDGQGRELLEYCFVDDGLLLFHLTGTELRLYRLPGDDSLRYRIDALRQNLQAAAYADVSLRPAAEQRALDAAYAESAGALFTELLGPVAGRLGPRLILVPDGVLGYLPFDALLTGPVRSDDYARLPYFGLAHQLQYSYSAAYLLQLAATRPPAAAIRKVLAFAPAFGPTDLRRMSTDRATLLPLAFNLAEVAAIKELVPTEIRAGDGATREQFVDLASQYACLHLSSHAVVDADDADFSYIAFTQSGDSLNAAELLYLNDLYALRLPADLAVLSACETSMGRIAPGEGVLSLARAFAYAGARATTTTLWNVNDRATKEVIVAYYAELKAGYDKSEALWRAKRKMVDAGEYAHPYYWSGLVLYGDAQPLDLPGLGYGWWWTIGAIVLVALLLLWQLFRLRRRSPKR